MHSSSCFISFLEIDLDESKEELHLDEPTHCLCKNHEGVEIVNERFALPVDQLFALIFDDSPFYRHFQAQRKTTNIVLSPWSDANSDDFKHWSSQVDGVGKQRKLTYTLQINHALAKHVQASEVQWMHPQSRPGCRYMVRSLCQNSGIPYSDAFEVISQWCLKRGNGLKECELRVHALVNFRKTGWTIGLMKGMIEKSSIQGMQEYCSDLIEALHGWCRQRSLERRQNASFEFSIQSESQLSAGSFSTANGMDEPTDSDDDAAKETEESDNEEEGDEAEEQLDADDEDEKKTSNGLKAKRSFGQVETFNSGRKLGKRIRSWVWIERTTIASPGRRMLKWSRGLVQQAAQQIYATNYQCLIFLLFIALFGLAFLNVVLFLKLNQIEFLINEQEQMQKRSFFNMIATDTVSSPPQAARSLELDLELRETMSQLIQNWNLLIGKTLETFQMIESNLTQLNQQLNDEN